MVIKKLKDLLALQIIKEIEINHSETKLKYKIVSESDGKFIVEECH